MRKRLIVLLLAVLCAAPFVSFCSASDVSVTETTRAIPTYAYEQGLNLPLPHDGRAYPYPGLKFHDIATKTTPRVYRAVVLENEYLKLTVLPDLGGRIIQLIYKPTRQSVFYENNVMKPYQMCEQGWWLATGGMEFCFPITEHSTNILKPWIYCVQKHPDGSATITLSDTHRRTGLTESVAITLRPDSCAFALHIRLTNSQPTSKPFMFWMDPMLPANDQVEIIVPTTEMVGFDRNVTPWPVDKGVDVSKLGNWKEYNSLFAHALRAGFAGMYDHSRNLGLVRAFPLSEARGVKIFSYGHTTQEILQPNKYSDSEDRYFEPWGGYTSAFWDRAILEPHSVIEWSEDWYPVSATDGFKTASADMAVNAAIKQGQITLTIFPSRDIKSARIVLGSGGAVLGVWHEDLHCGKTLTKSVPVHSGHPYVTVYEGNRKILSDRLEWPKPVAKKPEPKKEEQPNGSNPAPQKPTEKPLSFDELFAKDRIEDAIKLYESKPVPKNRGSMDYAIALMRSGRYDDALAQFTAIKSNPAAAYQAGVLLLRKNEVAGARSMFALSAMQNPKDAGVQVALGVTWLSGDKTKAASYYAKALDLDTNNLLALAEMADLQDAQARARIEAALSQDPQNAVYIALGYLELNALPKAELYAERAVDTDPNNVTALAALIDSRVRLGKADAADEALTKLRQVDVEKSVVYGGDDSVMALEEAARARPNDSRVMIHLASAYQERDSLDAAADMAKRVAEAEPTCPRAFFVQAQALAEKAWDKQEGDVQMMRHAARYMEQCIALKPLAEAYYKWTEYICSDADRWHSVVAAMRQLNDLDPKCRLPYSTLGWSTMEDCQDYPAAIKLFKTGDDIYGEVVAYAKWMENLLDAHQSAKLAEVYQEAAKLPKTHSMEASYTCARAAQALGKQAEARADLEEMKSRKDDVLERGWSENCYFLGCAFDDLGEKDTARLLWTKCKGQLDPMLEEHSSRQGILFLMALTQDRLGQHQEALDTINKMWKSQKNSDEVKVVYERISAALNAAHH